MPRQRREYTKRLADQMPLFHKRLWRTDFEQVFWVLNVHKSVRLPTRQAQPFSSCVHRVGPVLVTEPGDVKSMESDMVVVGKHFTCLLIL